MLDTAANDGFPPDVSTVHCSTVLAGNVRFRTLLTSRLRLRRMTALRGKAFRIRDYQERSGFVR